MRAMACITVSGGIGIVGGVHQDHPAANDVEVVVVEGGDSGRIGGGFANGVLRGWGPSRGFLEKHDVVSVVGASFVSSKRFVRSGSGLRGF